MKPVLAVALVAVLAAAIPAAAFSTAGSFTTRCDLGVFAPAATAVLVRCTGGEGIPNPAEAAGSYAVTFSWTPLSGAYRELVVGATWCNYPPGGQLCTGGVSARGASPITVTIPADATAQELRVNGNPTSPTIVVLHEGPPTVRIVEPAVYFQEPEQTVDYAIVHAS